MSCYMNTPYAGTEGMKGKLKIKKEGTQYQALWDPFMNASPTAKNVFEFILLISTIWIKVRYDFIKETDCGIIPYDTKTSFGKQSKALENSNHIVIFIFALSPILQQY